MTEAEQFFKEHGINVHTMSCYDFSNFNALHELRQEYIARFGFAIITDDLIKAITSYEPLLEIGCGSGYWTYELRKAGADVLPTDPAIGKYRMIHGAGRWENLWVEIENIDGAAAVQKYPTRNLLMVWPDYNDQWAFETIQVFKGDVVLYCGEGDGGCTATEEFHDYLRAHFNKMADYRIPQFDGIHDSLEVWKRL
jgi:hypothetical protein